MILLDDVVHIGFFPPALQLALVREIPLAF
jgi:hypothetical protein